ncbi:MAG: GNAT family N-acetyltransferase [Rhodobacteraceae bacterium]|nr:GNAT family N-acetyltransferase [Paracoccaceae bacterium]
MTQPQDFIIARGRYRARFATTSEDVARAQRLRYQAFIAARRPENEAPPADDPRDADTFDRVCRHVLVEAQDDGHLVCCFRLLHLEGGDQIGRSYSAQYYDLERLRDFPGPMVEMGRFCIDPDVTDPDVLRIAWAAVTLHVDREGVQMLFGCSSFAGTEAEGYMDAFALLQERHIAPRRWLPRVKAPRVFRFGNLLRGRAADRGRAMRTLPPLLRSYLVMGGWVSDHAVVDRDLGTLHVFTGLEIAAIPPGRARLLRADAS